MTVEGEAWPYCPRTILRNQLARAKALGYDFKVGAELEYFLIRRREDGGSSSPTSSTRATSPVTTCAR